MAGEFVHDCGVVCLWCHDLTASARTLNMDRLLFWRSRLSRGGLYDEVRILDEEIERRDPRHAHGTLWQFAE